MSLQAGTRWKGHPDFLRVYIKNWHLLLRVCEEHRNKKDNGENVDSDISRHIMDVKLKQKAKRFVAILKPIAIALDRLQNDSTKISDAVVIWKRLQAEIFDLNEVTEEIKDRFTLRYGSQCSVVKR